jgi:hypothetical protein
MDIPVVGTGFVTNKDTVTIAVNGRSFCSEYGSSRFF